MIPMQDRIKSFFCATMCCLFVRIKYLWFSNKEWLITVQKKKISLEKSGSADEI